jgi:3-methyl-2-oxobutanoate hydroxymethyltransferase
MMMSLCPEGRKKVTLSTLKKLYEAGEPIAMLTCYDSSFAALEDNAGVDMILIGDSLGMTIQGHDSTIPVTMRDMIYHTECVARGARNTFIVTDMPFGSYQNSEEEAVKNAVDLMRAGANMVKFEGGKEVAPLVRKLVSIGIPVCAHIGFTPQAVNILGGYFVQGRKDDRAAQLKEDAAALQEAGASIVLMEMVPAALAAEITESLSVPTIGIGAGAGCSGQVLVLQDILGVYPGRKIRFVKNFMEGASSIQQAAERYVAAVKTRTFPTSEHSF